MGFIVPLTFALLLINFGPGEAFFMPRPQLLELSQDKGFENVVKGFFGVPVEEDLKMKALRLTRQRRRCLLTMKTLAEVVPSFRMKAEDLKKLCKGKQKPLKFDYRYIHF